MKIQNARKGPFGAVLMYFDLALPMGIVLKGLTLKRSQKGAYYVGFPAKQRLDKDKQPVMKDGYQVWDDHIQFELSNVEDKWSLTPEAVQAKADILAYAVEAFEAEQAQNTGRGGRAPAPSRTAPAPARTAPARPSAPVTTVNDDEEFEDDELPF